MKFIVTERRILKKVMEEAKDPVEALDHFMDHPYKGERYGDEVEYAHEVSEVYEDDNK